MSDQTIDLYAMATQGRANARLENVRLRAEIDRLTAALAAERALGDDLAGSVRLLAEIERAQISNSPDGTYGVVRIMNGAVLLYSDMREVASECLARYRAARQEGGG